MVIDSGPPGIAPLGETPPQTSVSCLVVPSGETGLQGLQRAADLRFHTSGLICGIAGFPARECPGQTADAVTPQPAAEPRTPVEQGTPPPPPPSAVAPGGATPADTPDPQPTSSPTDTPGTPQAVASPVPVSLGTPGTPAEPSQPPAWIAAIGAALIAALLGLAVLARRGRG